MLNKEDVKVGVLIWWNGSGYAHEWSCPCIITKVGETSFKVKSLDDFKETEDLRMDDDLREHGSETSRNKMRLCSLEEVQGYFKKRNRNFEDMVKKAKRSLEDIENSQSLYKEKIERFYEEWVLKQM